MPDIDLQFSISTAELEAQIPRIMSFGRRTLREQCVTSAALICLDAQELTPAVDLATIDSDMEVIAYPEILKNGKASRDKKKQRAELAFAVDKSVAEMIVVARMHPGSRYSMLTGNRWPVAMPQTKGTADFWGAVQDIAERMVRSRASSTHYLQHGWSPAINQLLRDPAYYAGKSRVQLRAQSNVAPLNTVSPDALGGATVQVYGDACFVTAENRVGSSGPSEVLNEKHQAALIEYGMPPTQAAIDREAVMMSEKVQDYIDREMPIVFDNLL